MIHPHLIVREAVGIDPEELAGAQHVEANRQVPPDVALGPAGGGFTEDEQHQPDASEGVDECLVARRELT